ncbi:protein of unknown function [Taphrina deformans PYCC 5710]|uniref:GDS1 winged helix domain-containing protein n=1 Tax=Taphrina deformans (strain PYCC 5710 / ATCC 11124 / CBS 356.35 / IMI 108563 / JCM 9778 / NBRC 8474) TaxID=1097556 RepID=S0BE61_TAPDE|nr:protein of unknown function [Taphrina deformans PYCC 5710]|eukprot:CCG84886.1 protein of unknown function [Taphrina deformans PYCC 5710]
MAVTAVTSNYNVRRRKQSINATARQQQDESLRLTKRAKLDKRDVFTPPASPEATDAASEMHIGYEDDHEDAVLIGILDFMQRNGGSALCSREISEGLQAEGKVSLSGATPSTVVDASIKQHHKRCSSNNRANLIQKVADPHFPRKTLYHLANVDPFAPRPRLQTPKLAPVLSRKDSGPRAMETEDHESTASDDESEYAHPLDSLSNDGQGPFAASLDTRRRMSLSPSPELDFSLTIDDVSRSANTPVASVPTSPSKEQITREQRRQQLNIALPPSPFMTPQRGMDDETDADAALKLPELSHSFMNSPILARRELPTDDDLDDVDVQSPEAVSLDDLDCLLGF